MDNCPLVAITAQLNTDGDLEGDSCDCNDDNDGFIDELDHCPAVANPSQSEPDGDGQGDACDADDDNDGMLDGFEEIHRLNPLDATDAALDNDGDGASNLEEFERHRNPLVNEHAVIQSVHPILFQ